MTLREAAGLLSLSYRQAKRCWRRYRRLGDVGLVHGLRGRPSNNQDSADARREQALSLYRQHLQGLGPTLASEQLQDRHGLAVNHETLRRWLTSAGLWRVRRERGVGHRPWRERRTRFGELVQLDGSHHAWLGSGHAAVVLMVMVDDATGWTQARFFEAESTHAALSMVRQWVLRHGRPLGLYTDRHSIYRRSDAAALEHFQRTQQRLPTQWGRAMEDLGIELICAHSPQAKGRVERMNGVLQDRLVKLLKLEGITDMAAANAYLEQTYLPRHNARFARRPATSDDAHRPAPSADELDGILTQRHARLMSKAGLVNWQGRGLVVKNPCPRSRGRQVEVREHLDGRLTLWRGGRAVAYQALERTATAASTKADLRQRVARHARPWKPPATHPWKSGLPSPPALARAPAGRPLRSGRTRCARPPCATRPASGKGTVLLC
jgi:hypothetical protein